eukprot:SAG11_NODE_4622_length_1831_cov_1.153002_1_plen_242_part_10
MQTVDPVLTQLSVVEAAATAQFEELQLEVRGRTDRTTKQLQATRAELAAAVAAMERGHGDADRAATEIGAELALLSAQLAQNEQQQRLGAAATHVRTPPLPGLGHPPMTPVAMVALSTCGCHRCDATGAMWLQISLRDLHQRLSRFGAAPAGSPQLAAAAATATAAAAEATAAAEEQRSTMAALKLTLNAEKPWQVKTSPAMPTELPPTPKPEPEELEAANSKVVVEGSSLAPKLLPSKVEP